MSMVRRNSWQVFKKILYTGFRAILNLQNTIRFQVEITNFVQYNVLA